MKIELIVSLIKVNDFTHSIAVQRLIKFTHRLNVIYLVSSDQCLESTRSQLLNARLPIDHCIGNGVINISTYTLNIPTPSNHGTIGVS